MLTSTLTATLTVENMVSPNTGKPVVNQFVIKSLDTIVFQSYKSSIIELDYETRTIYVYEDWNRSTTTSKYRNAFMRRYIGALDSTQALLDAMESDSKFYGWRVVKSFI